MNPPRLLGEGRSFYHCVSRVVDRRFVFEDMDKEVFRKILRVLERFTGVRAVTYCVMSNHFHLLLDIPEKKELAPLTLAELMELLPDLHDATVAEGVRQEIERALESERAAESNALWQEERRASGGESGEQDGASEACRSGSGSGGRPVPRTEVDSDRPGAEREGAAFWEELSAHPETGVAGILARYERRRGDLSVFMKMLKIRLTKYMNCRLDRVGTLWESRFKSVLIEGDEAALMAVAAYIDLNPVRAGIVARPEDYAYSGYGEACSRRCGRSLAKRGLGCILREALGSRGQDALAAGEGWRRTLRRYRLFLYEKGVAREADPATGAGARAGVAPDEVAALLSESEDEAALADLGAGIGGLLQGRVRYFTDGGVLGRAAFVDSIFDREKKRGGFGANRRSGARRLRGADWGPLRILRDLQKSVFGAAVEAPR